jgi:hypothetical protein
MRVNRTYDAGGEDCFELHLTRDEFVRIAQLSYVNEGGPKFTVDNGFGGRIFSQVPQDIAAEAMSRVHKDSYVHPKASPPDDSPAYSGYWLDEFNALRVRLSYQLPGGRTFS